MFSPVLFMESCNWKSRMNGNCHCALASQFRYRNCCTASIFRLMANVVDQWMGGQEFRQAAT
jgi:hypothetical protein